MLLGIGIEKQNVACVISLAFGIAASSTFPLLILLIIWPGFTTWARQQEGQWGYCCRWLLRSRSLDLGSDARIFAERLPIRTADYRRDAARFRTLLYSIMGAGPLPSGPYTRDLIADYGMTAR